MRRQRTVVLALVLAVAILALVSRDKLGTGNAFMAFALGYGALRIVADLLPAPRFERPVRSFVPP